MDATGRPDLIDALHWIAEGRPVKGTINSLLGALVEASKRGHRGADAALRFASRAALRSDIDTSADLLATDAIVPPDRYMNALAAVASRTTSQTLSTISAEAVGAAQAANPLVMEALSLVAGLSWRDLRERCEISGVPLPPQSDRPWSSSQIRAAFAVIDEIVTGQAKPQLPEAVAARPIELLIGAKRSWDDVEAFRIGGVTYGTLLAQRDVGSAWSAHRNRTNGEISRLMVERLLAALTTAGVEHWSTEGPNLIPRAELAQQAVHRGRAPGQLSVVTRDATGKPKYAVLVTVARDGGTARKTGATLLRLPDMFSISAAAVLVGRGWADRGESDDLVRAFGGRIYTERSLGSFVALAAESSMVE